jgi:tellurite resistance protein TerC
MLTTALSTLITAATPTGEPAAGTIIPAWFEITSLTVVLAILAADLFLAFRRPHIPSTKESALWVGFYVTLALLFALALLLIGDGDHATEFIAGWATEYSLSIDNLFVFVIIMARFSVPKKYQQEVLMVGIIIALVLRGIFILLGAALIENFSFIFYIFGAFLLFTAIQQATESSDEVEDKESAVIRFLRRRVSITDQFDGVKLRTIVDGKKAFTPILIVFIAIGTTDLVFALDSIPAIFGITQNPFIVFTANVFALMGLRQLYFLLGDLIDKLEYLRFGIAAVLFFIGVKLILHAMHVNELPFVNGGQPIEWAPEISTEASLAFILAAMGIATIASLVKLRIVREREKTNVEE